MIFAMNRYEGCRLVHCSLPINVERFVWSSSSPKTIRQGAELVQNIFLCADNSSSCSKRQTCRWSGLFFFFEFTHVCPCWKLVQCKANLLMRFVVLSWSLWPSEVVQCCLRWIWRINDERWMVTRSNWWMNSPSRCVNCCPAQHPQACRSWSSVEQNNLRESFQSFVCCGISFGCCSDAVRCHWRQLTDIFTCSFLQLDHFNVEEIWREFKQRSVTSEKTICLCQNRWWKRVGPLFSISPKSTGIFTCSKIFSTMEKFSDEQSESCHRRHSSVRKKIFIVDRRREELIDSAEGIAVSMCKSEWERLCLTSLNGQWALGRFENWHVEKWFNDDR